MKSHHKRYLESWPHTIYHLFQNKLQLHHLFHRNYIVWMVVMGLMQRMHLHQFHPHHDWVHYYLRFVNFFVVVFWIDVC